jgi:hypothetical protein
MPEPGDVGDGLVASGGPVHPEHRVHSMEGLPKMKQFLVILCGLLLSGCAVLGTLEHRVVMDLSKVTVIDAQTAVDMATVATDPEAPYRAECYRSVLAMAQTLPAPNQSAPKIAGVLSAFEAAAELDRKLRGASGGDLLPQDVRAKCAILVLSTEEFLGRVGLKVGRGLIPGGSLLPFPGK